MHYSNCRTRLRMMHRDATSTGLSPLLAKVAPLMLINLMLIKTNNNEGIILVWRELWGILDRWSIFGPTRRGGLKIDQKVPKYHIILDKPILFALKYILHYFLAFKNILPILLYIKTPFWRGRIKGPNIFRFQKYLAKLRYMIFFYNKK